MVRRIQAKLVLRLRAEGLSGRAIAASQNMSRHSVAAVIDAADGAGVGWDDVVDLPDAEVYALLFPGRGEHVSVFVEPDWSRVHQELARVGVTLRLLHGEYVDATAAGGGVAMGYDRFCKSYSHYLLVAGAASRVGHKAGRTVEVDWSGPTMRLADPVSGATQKVYLFVGCLPFSRYSFVEPTLDMRQDTWLRAHVAMFGYFGGSVPRIVSDNLKTGVISHPREGEIVLNDAYRELAAHYSAAVLPGRVRKAKDKPSVENTVGNIATAVIAALRDETFTSLSQLREAIRARLADYNAAPFQKRAGSRIGVFTAEEAPLLRPLPVVEFEISQWARGRRVGRDGHVVWARNRYSVPFTHIGEQVDLRVSDTTLEVWRHDERLASHPLLPATTVNAYRTREADLSHGRPWREWDPDRVRAWAERVGPGASRVVERVFESVAVDEQGLDAALAVLRLSRRYTEARLEAACTIALGAGIRSPRYAHLQPVLATGQDKTALTTPHPPRTPPTAGSSVGPTTTPESSGEPDRCRDETQAARDGRRGSGRRARGPRRHPDDGAAVQ